MKKSTSLTLIAVLAVLISMGVFQYIKNKNDYIITSGVRFFTRETVNNLKADSYFFLKEIAKHTDNERLLIDESKYDDDYFIRLINKEKIFASIKTVMPEVYPPFTLDPENEFAKSEPLGGVMLKALHCDVVGYDDYDFSLLKTFKGGDGSYWDTHVLIALLFLKSNGCYQPSEIEELIKQVVTSIIEAEKTDTVFSDTYAERIVVLYWAGYGDSVEKKWIDFIKNNFNKDLGWKAHRLDSVSHPHTTGLALLSLIYYQEAKPEQSFY